MVAREEKGVMMMDPTFSMNLLVAYWQSMVALLNRIMNDTAPIIHNTARREGGGSIE